MSKDFSALGERMKQYEFVSRGYLTRRVPVVIRLDGKAFHTFTKKMRRPFDRVLMTAMQKTMKMLCENIQGCVLGYTQSDEITLVLTDYDTIHTDAWFEYNTQKMCSIAASMATLAFNRAFEEEAGKLREAEETEWTSNYSVYEKKFYQAMFDARAFSVPKEEVCNCLIWRQQDATRNSINAVGQANFSHKQLQGKNTDEVQDMLWREREINWNDFPTDCKRGSCAYKVIQETEMPDPRNPEQMIRVKRRKWVVDNQIPIFTQDRNFVEQWL